MAQLSKNISERYRSFLRSPYFWGLLGGVATIVALLAYNYLPERRLELAHADVQAYVYADAKNSAQFVNLEALKWRCTIKTSHSYAFCGMHLVLGDDSYQGIDLTRFHSFDLKLDYQGEASSLRYYVRNREPEFSDQADLQTHKFMQARIATKFLDDGLVIGLDEFYVPEWWLT